MNPQLLPAQLRDDVPAWAQTVVAFLAEKERRSGSRRTVEGYARMLWPFLERIGSPDRVTPAHVLAWAHGIGLTLYEPPIIWREVSLNPPDIPLEENMTFMVDIFLANEQMGFRWEDGVIIRNGPADVLSSYRRQLSILEV